MNIIDKITKAGLKGRGGANFPTDLKWRAVAEAVAKHPQHKSYVVCNVAEGEPGVMKDAYILKHYPEVMITGIKTALATFKSEQAFIYLRRSYFRKYKDNLHKIIKEQNLPIVLFAETGGYLCGEETTLLESLEGKREEPRLRPPFPTTNGYLGFPTLVNNAETFYCVGRIAQGDFKQTRFYSISGAVKHQGVYELPQDYTVKQVLIKTNNLPKFKYFVQVGGGASGDIFTAKEAGLASGGTIMVYDLAKTKPLKLMRAWVDFFYKQNCGKCTPCREGLFRLRHLLSQASPDLAELNPILTNMRDASFCPLGRSVFYPMNSLITKIMKYDRS